MCFCSKPGASWEHEQPRQHQPEDLTRLFVERANAGDAEGLAALYEPDAVVAFPPGSVTVGREAIQALYEQMLADVPAFTPREPLRTVPQRRSRADRDTGGRRGRSPRAGRTPPAGRDVAARPRPAGLQRLAAALLAELLGDPAHLGRDRVLGRRGGHLASAEARLTLRSRLPDLSVERAQKNAATSATITTTQKDERQDAGDEAHAHSLSAMAATMISTTMASRRLAE